MPKPTLFSLVQGHGGMPVSLQPNIPQLPVYSPVPYPIPGQPPQAGAMPPQGGAPVQPPQGAVPPQAQMMMAPPQAGQMQMAPPTAAGGPGAPGQMAPPTAAAAPPAPPLSFSANIPGMENGGKVTMQIPRERFDDVWEHVKGFLHGGAMRMPAYKDGGTLNIPGYETGGTADINTIPLAGSGTDTSMGGNIATDQSVGTIGLNGAQQSSQGAPVAQYTWKANPDGTITPVVTPPNTPAPGTTTTGGSSSDPYAAAILESNQEHIAEMAREFNATQGTNKALAESQDTQARQKMIQDYWDSIATQEDTRNQLATTAATNAGDEYLKALASVAVPGLTAQNYTPVSNPNNPGAANINWGAAITHFDPAASMPHGLGAPNIPAPQFGAPLNLPLPSKQGFGQ